MSLNLPEEWQFITLANEAIAYDVYAGEGRYSPSQQVVQNTLWLQAKATDLQGGKLLASKTRVVYAWNEKLATIAPKIGDVLQRVDNTRWTVKDVDAQAFGNRYRLVVLKEVG